MRASGHSRDPKVREWATLNGKEDIVDTLLASLASGAGAPAQDNKALRKAIRENTIELAEQLRDRREGRPLAEVKDNETLRGAAPEGDLDIGAQLLRIEAVCNDAHTQENKALTSARYAIVKR